MKTLLHQRTSNAATKAAAEARHKAAGQELRPISAGLLPIKKPTKAPKIISAFIQQEAVKHNLCHWRSKSNRRLPRRT
jgi:hypothetical protein